MHKQGLLHLLDHEEEEGREGGREDDADLYLEPPEKDAQMLEVSWKIPKEQSIPLLTSPLPSSLSPFLPP